MSQPKQNPTTSKQDYNTPEGLLTAVKSLLVIEKFDLDIAADKDNAVSDSFYTEEDDALKDEHFWGNGGWSWLNPPYKNLEPWAKKAHVESLKDAKIAMLVPASPGSNWWREWVHGKALVLFLNGRITFKGMTTPYPKDSALLLYGIQPKVSGYRIWDWKKGNIF